MTEPNDHRQTLRIDDKQQFNPAADRMQPPSGNLQFQIERTSGPDTAQTVTEATNA